jgi:hypothetical protein
VTLPVEVSREKLHAIEAPASFEASGPFEVAVTNHGRPAHVHLKLDDDLARVASLPESNYYVERDATVELLVEVDPGATATGRLVVQTGYGSETAATEVSLSREAPDPPGRPVAAGPDPTEDDDDGDDGGRSPSVPDLDAEGSLPIVALGGVALAMAAGVAALGDDLVLTAGVAAALLAVLAAVLIVVR